MTLSVNLRHLARQNIVLKGDLPAKDLNLETGDEMVQATHPLAYDLEAQLLDDNLLIRGSLTLPLDCQCVRCLKSFNYKLEMGDWAVLLPLKGEEKVDVIDDSVDLTGPIREDILLALPAHPVCDPECVGLTAEKAVSKKKGASQAKTGSPVWAELDKLKLAKTKKN
jgi:uncharacterized protein